MAEAEPPRIPQASPLPAGALPRGLSRIQAAAYVGVSASLFDAMVKDGRMPKPKRINARTVWDRYAIDAAFSDLDGGDPAEGDDSATRPDDEWSGFAV